MRVFVAGATGVIGHRAVRALVAAGHEVTAVVRSPDKAAFARTLGATPVEVSIFDPDALRAAAAGHDAVCNLATHIPPLARAAGANAWAENTRIRAEGSRNLVDAALAAGATVYVQESIAFLYGDHRDEWVDASSTPISDNRFAEPVRTAEAEAKRFADAGGRGVVLRFGMFLAPDSEQMLTMARSARRGISISPGDADGYFPSIHADDAATAVVAALTAPTGTYDVTDDEPLRRGEQRDAMGAAVGRKRLFQMRSPKSVVGPLGDSQRVSNQRFRDATPWTPRFPSARESWTATVRDAHLEPALSGWVRLFLWLMAIGSVGVAFQALFTPRSFYDDFPLGRGWVMMDGPYNEHLVRDVGSLNLALVVLVLIALWVSTRTLARTAAVVYLVNALPHFFYHARHIGMDGMATGDRVGILFTLGGAVILPILVLLFFRPETYRYDVKIAAVQHNIVWEDRDANFARLAPMIATAAIEGARLVVLSEMFSTGFSMATELIAEPADGPSVQFLVNQAREHDVWVCGSIPERPAGAERPFNQLVLAAPDGAVHRYAKIHPFGYGAEHEHYAAGDAFLTVDVEGVRCSFFVCYDLRFADEFWPLAPATDCYVVPANWPQSRRAHWSALLRARAIENQAYVVGVNRVGEGGGLAYVGDSVIVDPLGEVLVDAGAAECVRTAEVDPAHVAALRARFPFLADRR